MRALPTGVELFDYVLGGITPGFPCVLAGPSGAGRTVLSIELAVAALEAGRVVSFLCNEPAPFLIQQAQSFGIDLEPSIRSGKLALLEMDSEIASCVTAQGTEALVEAVAAEQPLCSLLIIDPVTVLTCGIFDEAQMRASARNLVRSTAEWSVLLTAESERLALQQGLEKTLGEVCGSFAALSRDENGVRRLVVEKTRSGVGTAESVRFTIDDNGSHLLAEKDDAAERDAEAGCEPAGSSAADERAETPPAMPAARPAAARETVATPAPGHELDARKCILIVDDDMGSREELGKWLSAEYDVQTAHDGFEAMSAVLAERPDLVILDLVMPRVTGYELLAAFQRSMRDVPSLVVSSRMERPADRLSPLVLGATDVLSKPVERFELMHKVDLLLTLTSQTRQLMDPAEAQALFATPGKSRQMDTERFHERLERACRFGDRFDIQSSLLAVRGESSTAIDELLEVMEANLRFEDAALRVSARRAVVLLVATPGEDAATVAERLVAQLPEPAARAQHIRHEIHAAHHVEAGFDWHDLFRTHGPEAEDAEEPDE